MEHNPFTCNCAKCRKGRGERVVARAEREWSPPNSAWHPDDDSEARYAKFVESSQMEDLG